MAHRLRYKYLKGETVDPYDTDPVIDEVIEETSIENPTKPFIEVEAPECFA